MKMDIDTLASDFEEPESDEPPPPKKAAPKKKAAAPAKKAPAKGRGKKAAVLVRKNPYISHTWFCMSNPYMYASLSLNRTTL
jgi:hypothetical protein